MKVGDIEMKADIFPEAINNNLNSKKSIKENIERFFNFEIYKTAIDDRLDQLQVFGH